MYVCLHACMWVYAHEWAELCIESRFLWMYMGVHLHSFMLCYVCVYLCFPERSEVLYTSRNRCPLQFHVRLCMCIFIFCQREVRCFILVGIDVHYFVHLCNAPTHIKIQLNTQTEIHLNPIFLSDEDLHLNFFYPSWHINRYGVKMDLWYIYLYIYVCTCA